MQDVLWIYSNTVVLGQNDKSKNFYIIFHNGDSTLGNNNILFTTTWELVKLHKSVNMT
ncbi:hypothetical protein KPH14_000589, partial [Odynerus spinipes]